MSVADVSSPPKHTWLDQPIQAILRLNWETILFTLLMIVAAISRFYDLEARVMSHDENSHVYFSWLYEQGNGYSHDPVTHGPFQFHVVALSYFLFGDNDFTARIPAALFSIATIAFMLPYRRLLGRVGALIAALLLLISPYMLYYGRYVRNEAFVAFYGVITLWAIIRYLESGANRYLIWLTAAIALHFATKETSYIYAAQALLFLAAYLIYSLSRRTWRYSIYRNRFFIFLILALLTFSIAGSLLILGRGAGAATGAETISPAVPGQQMPPMAASAMAPLALVIFLAGILCLIIAIYFVLKGYTWFLLRQERSFDLLILLGTLVLPLLAAFPVKLLGISPIDYQSTRSVYADAAFVILFAVIGSALGLLWKRRTWLINAIIFYTIFTVLYTSLFTNGFGFLTGLVGSLGYWLDQQAVNRGSQPWYYYGLVQLPIYEFLPYLGTILATIYASAYWKRRQPDKPSPADANPHKDIPLLTEESRLEGSTIVLLLYWSFTSLIAYSIAGEKMPWLTVHIAWPMILSTAWYLDKLIASVDWDLFHARRGVILLLLLPVFLLSSIAVVLTLLGPNPPFQGKELNQLQSTSTFIFALISAIASGWGVSRLSMTWQAGQLTRSLTLAIFALLAMLTARAAIRAAYINYDYATEFLVYAHSAPGDKLALAQIEEISRRTTDGLAIKVAYDSDTSYPFWWYLRNYSNKVFYGNEPTRSLRDCVAILVGEGNFGKIEPVVGQAYYRFDYIRLWWPNQDYFGLTLERIFNALRNPQMRAALFQIWLNRDYTLYGQVTNKDMSLPNWYPSAKMRLYIRKDVAASIWNYGTTPAPEEIIADPYEGKDAGLVADKIIGAQGSEAGQFNRPRDLDLAADGSIYVADTENHRIQHLDQNGNVLHVWGSYAASLDANNPAPEGTFNEPWGIAVAPDGSVYVADTWNNRIQKFSAEGNFITSWGYGISQSDDPYGFYGPRDVAVDQSGRVFVSDTGNKRILVFDSDGNFLTKFGGAGMAAGQFDEPVGIAIDSEGLVYIADTWNQRVQVFMAASDGSFIPLTTWDIVGWYGQSLDNKPYLDIDQQGNLFVADPEANRILQFKSTGEFLQYWGDYSTGADGFNLVGSVSVDAAGGVWVSDTNNHRLMHFIYNPSP